MLMQMQHLFSIAVLLPSAMAKLRKVKGSKATCLKSQKETTQRNVKVKTRSPEAKRQSKLFSVILFQNGV